MSKAGGRPLAAASFDAEAVRAFERAGWETAAAEYRATFAVATGEFVGALLDAGGVGAGTRALDLACGPGIVTGAAAARGAAASGLDFSPAMLAVARAAHPQLAFAEGDAEAVPLADGCVDAVVSNFGIHHVPRPERALAEAFRLLRPGGRLAFTTWASPAENIPWQLLQDAIRLHGDPGAAQSPPSGGGLGHPEAVLELLKAAGFADPAVVKLRREWRLAQPGDLVASLRRGTVRTAALIEAQNPAALPAIEAEIARRAAAYHRGGRYRIPIVALLGSGMRIAAVGN